LKKQQLRNEDLETILMTLDQHMKVQNSLKEDVEAGRNMLE